MDTQLFTGKLVRLTAANPETDAEVVASWSRDSEFLRLLDDEAARPWSPREIKKEMEQGSSAGFEFMIRTLAEDRLIGFVGLHRDIRWAHGDAWTGIGIGDRRYWGKGYGTDAMRVLLRYAFTELNLRRVTLGVFEYNARAIRAYEKAGFVVEGRSRQEMLRDGRRWDALTMGILREDWQRISDT